MLWLTVLTATVAMRHCGFVSIDSLLSILSKKMCGDWPILEKSVRIIGDYGQRFADAFPTISKAEDVTIIDIRKVLAAFLG